jgi:alpha-beta hydrolase superfamily lysophospholipase
MAGSLVMPRSHAGPPVLILCHGALDFKENFDELAGFLASRGIASLAIDMHGHGACMNGRFHVNMGDWVEDIRMALAYLLSLSWTRPDSIGAVGFSSGGTAVLEAASAGVRLGCIVTLDATVCNTLGPLEGFMVRALGAAGLVRRMLTGDDLRLDLRGEFRKARITEDEAFNTWWTHHPRVLEMWSSVPFPGIMDAFMVDTIERVRLIRTPTLVIHGREDKVDPPASAERLFDALNCPKGLSIVPGNGHMGHKDTNRAVVFDLVSGWARAHLV